MTATRSMRNLGPVVAPPIGLGCMGLSWQYDESVQDPAGLLHRALDIGTTLLDTADIYGPYSNETLIGEAIQHRRAEAVLATKGGLVIDDPATWSGHPDGRPEHLRAACEESLRRLGTEQIDIYFLHRPDPSVPVADSVAAINELAVEGKVRWVGVCELDVPTLEALQQQGLRIDVVESELSLAAPTAATDVVPWCGANGVGFLAYAPLGRGFLTGRFQSGNDLSAADWRATASRYTDLTRQAATLEHVLRLAAVTGHSPAQIALAWVLQQGQHVGAIPGSYSVQQVDDNAEAERIDLTGEQLALLATPNAAT